jgi:arylsulfatase I/J
MIAVDSGRGVRKGDWKLVWTSLLPPSVELFDLSKDPMESNNVADQNPEKVKELQGWAIDLAKEAKPPLFLLELGSELINFAAAAKQS